MKAELQWEKKWVGDGPYDLQVHDGEDMDELISKLVKRIEILEAQVQPVTEVCKELDLIPS